MRRENAAQRCVHCNLPLPSRPYFITADTGMLAFCCAGCAFVYRLTGQLGEAGEAAFWLARLGLGCFFAMNLMTLSLLLYAGYLTEIEPEILPKVTYLSFALATPVVIILGWPFAYNAWREIGTLSFSLDSLIALGVLAAYAASTYATFTGRAHVYFDTATMILVLVTLGRFLEAAAKARASEGLQQLLALSPQEATLLAAGEERKVAVAALKAGDHVVVRAGERIPADGKVILGTAAVDEAVLTGEARPLYKSPGDQVLEATVSVEGRLVVQVTQTGNHTVFAQIVRLMEAAQAARGPLRRAVDRMTTYFVPGVIGLALLTFLCRAPDGLEPALLHALTVLLIACPCPLGLATSLASWVGLQRAATCGVLVRSSEALERLAGLQALCFDKTGTLTTGDFACRAIKTEPGTEPDTFLSLCASVERYAEHALGMSLVARVAGKALPLYPVSDFTTYPGLGVCGVIDDPERPSLRVIVGSDRLLRQQGIHIGSELQREKTAFEAAGLTVILGAWHGQAQGLLAFGDQVRPESKAALAALKALGLRLCLLSGDHAAATRAVAQQVDIAEMRASLLPSEKVQFLRTMQTSGTVGVVGDGINDAPALAAASVGLAMGSGTDLAKQTADISMIGNDLRQVPWLIRLARATRKTIWGNLFWAFFYNTMGLTLAVQGLLTPILAALAMVVSSLFVIGNSLRLRKFPALHLST